MSSSDATMSVLFVDDDVDLCSEITDAFQEHGIDCRTCGDWENTKSIVETWHPDVIVLDQRLGTFDTLLKVPELRQISSAPVLFLTGSRSEADRVIGLELGADDFLLKPISGRELVARVRAHVRRVHRQDKPAAGDWRISISERRLYRPDGGPVALTSAEFDLLHIVAAKPGIPVDRETLSRQVLRRPYQAEDRSLDNLVHQIRRKLGRSGAGEVIASVRNHGYVFRGYPES